MILIDADTLPGADSRGSTVRAHLEHAKRKGESASSPQQTDAAAEPGRACTSAPHADSPPSNAR